MITTVLAVVATAVIAPVVTVHVMRLRGYRACELLDEAARREQENVEEARRLAAWWDYHQDWDNDLHYREQELRHRVDGPDPDREDTGHEPEHGRDDEEQPARARFEYREPGEVIAAATQFFAEEREQLAAHANLPHLNAMYGTDHFESPHITPEMQAIFEAAKWHLLHGGELTEALTAARVGMPTGAFPVLGGEDEQPSPLPPSKPVVPAAVAIRQIALATVGGAQ